MASNDTVWVPVLPSFKGFSKDMEKGTKGAGTAAGEQVARELEAAVSKSEKAVSSAAAAAEKAQNRVADATGKVRVAQEQYNKAIASGDPVKVARAEESLATARRRQGEATTEAEAKSKALAGTQKDLAASQDAVTRNAAEQERAVKASALSAEQAEQASKDLDTANVALAASMAAIVAGAVVVGKGLYDLGSQFDDMFDTIRIGTGASGDAFAGLQDSAMKVAQTIPAMDGGLSQIGSTMADLNTRLGATGEPLETLTGQFVQLTNMGIDADINSVSQALSGFGISAADAPAAMDELFQISQATGLSITELADSAVKGGPQLRQFGFDIGDSAALIGSLDKAGLDADKTIAGMSRAMVAFAKDGRDPKRALWETVVEIEKFTAAGNDVEALNLAGKMFGTRGAGQFVDAVKSGQLAVDDFVSATGASSDTILGVAGETADFAEQWQLFKQMLAVELAPVAERVFGAVGDSMTWLKDNALPALREMADWVGRNKDVLTALAIAVGSMASGIALARTGLLAFTAAQRVWNIVTLLSTQGVKGLNAAMKANLFGLIAGAIVGLVAGLTWFFTSTETGKAMWASFTSALAKGWEWVSGVLSTGWAWISQAFTTGWEWIKIAFAAAWAFIQPIFTGLKVAFAIVLTAVMLWWQGVKLYWGLVANVIVWAWNTVIKPVFDALKWGLQAVGAFFGWVWNALIKPAWNALGAGIAWVWNAVVRPVWDALKFALGLVGGAFQFYWNNVIKPAWDALGAGISWVWQNVIRPAWDALKFALGAVGDFFNWVWNAVIKPAWDALGAGIRWVADNVVHPVFEGLKGGLSRIETAFKKAVDWIGLQWDRIKGLTAAPIKFVIDTVYNNGIRAVWNKVAGWVGLEELPEWRPEWLGAYASGTSVLPGYSPGRDNMLFTSHDGRAQIALGGGEGIARPEVVRAMGPNGFDSLNSAARSGGVNGVRRQLGQGAQFNRGGIVDLGAFADGGTIADRAIARVFDIMRGENGKPYQYGGVGNPSWDCSGLWSGIYQELTGGSMFGGRVFNTESDFESFGFTPGANGRVSIGVMRGGGGPNSHMAGTIDGVNIESGGSGGVQFGGTAQGTSDFPLKWTLAELGGKFVEGVRGAGGGGSVIGSLVRQAFDSILKPIIDQIPRGPGLFGGIGPALGTKVADAVKDFILSKVPLGGGSGGVDVSGIDGPTVDVFQKVFEQFGWTGDQWEAAKWIYNKESGFDVNATNPSSGAFGVPQFLGATKDAYLPSMSTDPAVQAEAGARYIRDRYGNPLSAKAFWESHNWYDDGGWLMDGGLGVNQSGKPEPVFTNPQWTLIKSLVISTAQLLDPIRIMAQRGRDAVRHIADIADNSRRQLDHQIDLAGAAVWAALPREVQDAVTVAGAVGRQWEKVSGYLNEKAIAWSKGEWPIGSARTPVVEPGPGWEQFRLDDSLEKVARSNMALAEDVITGKVSPGNDPVANALFDIFGRDPILPDLARIASLGPNAIEAATDAAMHAFETGETARLEEWTASNSQLTEAVLRARDAAIVTGEMVQGAVNGYLNWAMASNSQGRMGSWQEYFQHYGGEYGTAQGDWLLSQVGLGGILSGKFKDSFANLLIETAKSPLLSAPPILDDNGRVIGTQLAGTAGAAGVPAPAMEAMELAAPPVVSMPEEALSLETETSPSGTQVTVEIPEGKTALSIDEFKEILVRIDERLDDVEIAIDGQADPAPLGLGVGGIA